MQSKRRMILLASLVFVIGLVSLFPARAAYRWFIAPHAAMSGIDGSVWNGSAAELSSNGLYLRNVNWRLQALPLLTGKLSYNIEANTASGYLNTSLAVGLGGSLLLSDLSAVIDLAELEQLLGMRGIGGNGNLQFATLHIKDGLPHRIEGNARINGLVVPPVYAASIGSYDAQVSTQENGTIVATVEDSEGPFDLAGSLQIQPGGSYSFLAQIAAQPGTPDVLRRQLLPLGSPNARGQNELRLEGQLQAARPH